MLDKSIEYLQYQINRNQFDIVVYQQNIEYLELNNKSLKYKIKMLENNNKQMQLTINLMKQHMEQNQEPAVDP